MFKMMDLCSNKEQKKANNLKVPKEDKNIRTKMMEAMLLHPKLDSRMRDVPLAYVVK